MKNLILATDSYKQSHFLQYPPATRRVSAYLESRRNTFADRTLFFGLQAFLNDYLAKPVTALDVAEAADLCAAHGVPFNRSGWEVIVNDHGGLLPIEISALAEGELVPTSVPLVQVVNTDDRLPWLATWIETALLRGIWYPTTVATLSWQCKKIIYAGLLKSSEDPAGQIPFKLHDFGARGVSSGESAALGGMAHLVNFIGSDTMESLLFAQRHYGAEMAGFSIPAAEHSTITSWGRGGEQAAYANMLTQFGGGGKTVAVVSDSYDLDHAVAEIWGGSLSSQVRATGGTLVVRPDSGDPVTTPLRTVAKLWEKFGGTTNAKGYRVLAPCVRVIQGDGMTLESIGQLVAAMLEGGWAIDNIAFGMGGGLLQHVNRDTLRFAMKANAIMDADGNWIDVFKQPATDTSKSSKAGRQAVVNDGGELNAIRFDDVGSQENLLQPVYANGQIVRRESFDAIRMRAEAALLAEAA